MAVSEKTVGRNAPCPCGSGKKYKHCHLAADEAAEAERHAPAIPRAPDFWEKNRSILGPPQVRSDEVGPHRQ